MLDLLDRVDRRLRDRPDLRRSVLHRTVTVAGAALNTPRYFDEAQALITVRLVRFEDLPQPVVGDGVIDMTWTVRLPADVKDGPVGDNVLAASFRPT